MRKVDRTGMSVNKHCSRAELYKSRELAHLLIADASITNLTTRNITILPEFRSAGVQIVNQILSQLNRGSLRLLTPCMIQVMMMMIVVSINCQTRPRKIAKRECRCCLEHYAGGVR